MICQSGMLSRFVFKSERKYYSQSCYSALSLAPYSSNSKKLANINIAIKMVSFVISLATSGECLSPW